MFVACAGVMWCSSWALGPLIPVWGLAAFVLVLPMQQQQQQP